MVVRPTEHRPTRRYLSAAVALAAGLSLAACGGQTEASTSSTGTASGDTPSEAAGEARDLAVAVVSPPNSLDPAQLVDGQQMFVWSAIYDTLLYKENGTGELVPGAAESWEYNGDGTELTLKIREGMAFSDGDPVDANAVAATMQRNMDTPGVVQAKFAEVTEISAVDNATVVVRFEQHDPQFVPNLALATGAIGDPDTMDEEQTSTNPVGSGPYTLDTARTVPGTTYVLTKREDHWNADAYPFTTLTVRALQDPTAAFNALQAGELNAATVRSQMTAQLGEDYTLTEIDAQALAYLNIQDRAGEEWPCLGDVRVRQAINHAIDQEGILTGILGGGGMVTDQVFSPYGEVYDESLADAYEYDPEKGRALVEEAGCTGTTFPIPSTFLTTAFEPTLSQGFTDIGLGLEWASVPPQQAQSAHLSGDYPLSLQITGFNSDATEAFLHYGPGGFANPQAYSDATTDELLAQIRSTVDPQDAVPLYRELNEYAVEQAFEAPIVFTGTTWATTDGVAMLDDGSSGIPSVRLFGAAE
jgi:peptide/nickel transport system substrate-binding protein